MSSTYSDRLKLELMATGANANTWGNNTNNNLEVLDAFAAGYLSKSVAGSSNITLTTANASDTAESSNKTIELTGALTGAISVFIPAVESEYNFFNNTSGSHDLKISATGHDANGVVIAQGAKSTVFCARLFFSHHRRLPTASDVLMDSNSQRPLEAHCRLVFKVKVLSPLI